MRRYAWASFRACYLFLNKLETINPVEIHQKKVMSDIDRMFPEIFPEIEQKPFYMFGSLLGIIHADGVLPGDGDIDISLFRKDFLDSWFEANWSHALKTSIQALHPQVCGHRYELKP